jgi:hypothetical protein
VAFTCRNIVFLAEAKRLQLICAGTARSSSLVYHRCLQRIILLQAWNYQRRYDRRLRKWN